MRSEPIESYPISIKEFKGTWLPVYRKVFAKTLEDSFPAEIPFADSSWQRIAMGYPFTYPTVEYCLGEEIENKYPKTVFLDEHKILFDTLAQLGVEHVVVATPDPGFGTEPSSSDDMWLCRANYSSVYTGFWQMSFEPKVLFSPDGSWGYISGRENQSVLGGNDKFMDAYLKNAGGMEAVKLKFWISDAESDGFAANSEPIKRHYAMLGWDAPPRPWKDAPKDEQWDIRIAEIQKHARRLKEIMGWTDESLGIA